MRSVVTGVVALIFGLFLGGLPARRELEKTKAELVRARSEGENTSGILPLFLGANGLGRDQGEAAPGEATEPQRRVPNFLKPEDGKQDSIAMDSQSGPPDAGASPHTFESVKTMLKFRAAFARQAFIEKADLGPDTQKHLEETVAQMNAEMAKVAEQAVQRLIDGKGKLKPRQMADLGSDILQIYRKADDELRAGLDPATQSAMDESEFDLFSQIDPSAFDKVQAELRRMGRGDE
jgi:hypothetical protein